MLCNLKNILKFIISLQLFLGFPSYSQAPNGGYIEDYGELKSQLSTALTLNASSGIYTDIAKNIDTFEGKYPAELSRNKVLRDKVEKIKRVNAIQKKLTLCLKQLSTNDSSIGRQVLAALQSRPELFDLNDDGCSSAVSALATLNKTERVMNFDAQKDIYKNFLLEIKKNSFSNMMHMNLALPDTKDTPEKIKFNMISQNCPRPCDPAFKAELSKMADQIIASKDRAPSQTFEQARDQIKSSIQKVNAGLDIPIIGANDKEREANGEARFQSMANTFWEEGSTGVGLLLHMDKMQSKTGSISTYSGLKKSKGTRTQRPIAYLNQKPLSEDITVQDMQAAKSEYFKKMLDHSKQTDSKLTDLEKQKDTLDLTQLKDNLKNEVADNPMIAAQMLMRDPAQTGFFCELFNEIDADETKNARRKKIRETTLLVVGGTMVVVGAALTMTGLGAAIGVPAVAVGTGMAAGGAALTMTELGYNARDYFTAQKELDQITISHLSSGKNLDLNSEIGKNKYLQEKSEISDIATNASMTLGLSAFGGLAFVRGASKYKALKANEVSKTEMQKLNQLSAYKNAVGDEQYAEMMGAISQLDPKVGQQVVELLLKKSKQGDSQMKKAFEELSSHIKASCAKT